MDVVKNSLEARLNDDLMSKMDLKAILYPLWLNKKVILVVTGLCLILGIFYTYIKIPLYASSVLLRVESKNANPFSGREFYNSMFQSQPSSLVDVQTALIKSSYILKPVIQKQQLDLSVSPSYFPFIGNWYARNHPDLEDKPWWGPKRYAWGGEEIKVETFDIPDTERNKPFTLVVLPNNQYALYAQDGQSILRGEVGRRVILKHQDKGQFTIQVNTLSAHIGTEFKLYKASLQELVSSLGSRIQITDVKQDMQLQNDTGILKVSLKGPNAPLDIAILNELAKVVVEKNAQAKLEETSKKLFFIHQQLPAIRQALNQAETKLSHYLSKHHLMDVTMASKLFMIEISSIQKSLNMIKINKAAALKKYTPLHPFVISLQEKEKIYGHELKNIETKIRKLPHRDQIILDMMREIRVKNQLYLLLLRSIQSLEVTKGSAVSDISILDYAQMPDAPLPSGTFKILTALSLFGFILGSGLVFLYQLWTKKVCDPSDIENEFGLTTMAIVPYSEKQPKFVMVNNHSKTLPILAEIEPKDLSIEALRSFRTSLQFTMLNASNNIVTITGVAPSVGKSFISLNFAYLLAGAGKRVLLVDGDIRKGHLKKYFNLKDVNGLSEVICGACTLEEAIISKNKQLDFLPTGSYPPNPSEILMSHSFKALLEQLSTSYDLVIIDTAPILAVTDPAVIASYAGTNCLVLASNMHDRKEIQLALKRFRANGVTINGVVFNFAKPQKGLNRASMTYNYQYNYN